MGKAAIGKGGLKTKATTLVKGELKVILSDKQPAHMFAAQSMVNKRVLRIILPLDGVQRIGARVAQSVSARPWCIRSRVRSPDLTSLFRLLSFQCSLSSFKYP